MAPEPSSSLSSEYALDLGTPKAASTSERVISGEDSRRSSTSKAPSERSANVRLGSVVLNTLSDASNLGLTGSSRYMCMMRGMPVP